MKQAKRLLALCLVLATVLCALPVTASAKNVASGKCGDHLTWTLDDKGVLTIDGRGKMYDYGGYWDEAAEDWIDRDSPMAEYRDQITSIVVKSGVTSIGAYAFVGCTLVNSVTLPNTVTNIGAVAFTNCESLQKFTVSASVTDIAESALSGCTSLTSISIDSKNKNYTVKDGVLFSKDMTRLLACPAGKSGTYTIPSSVTRICDSAFFRCEQLTKITIPNSVTQIGQEAFYSCSSLKSVVIPSRVTEIGGMAFAYCTSLSSVTIPNSVTDIYGYAFYCCDSLRNITVPASVKYIVDHAFGYICTGDTGWEDAPMNGFAISGYTGSAAETYAKENGFTFNALDKQTVSSQLPAPKITRLDNTVYGVQVTWGKVNGAARYRVFRWNDDKRGWEKVGDAGSTSFVDKTAVSGRTYAYTVRCMDSNGKYVSSYDEQGKSIQYVAAPSISLENTVYGVQVRWAKVNGAAKYRVFRKTSGSDWQRLGDVTSFTFVDKTAVSGTRYAYTVRCLNADGSYASAFKTAGEVIAYVAAPSVSKLENVAGGVQVSWSKVSGAAKYRVFRKTSGGNWQRVGDTTSTSFVDKTAVSGTRYAYTVRCLDKNGSYASAFNTSGKVVTYVAAPAIAQLASGADGVQLTWGKVSGAAKYRIFRKTENGGWQRLGDTMSTQWTDKTAQSGVTYTYTVRCVSSDGKTNLSGFDSTGKTIKR